MPKYESTLGYTVTTRLLVCPSVQVGEEVRVVVRCGRGAGLAQMESASGSDERTAWSTHIRASLVQLTSTIWGPKSRRRCSPSEGKPLSLRDSMVALGFSKDASRLLGGVMAYVQLGSHTGPGYHLHPAVGDSLIHSGGLNPAGPSDGLTRVPVALDAYVAEHGQSSGQMHRFGGTWAGVDTGSVTKDGSNFNTFRCTLLSFDLLHRFIKAF